MDFKQYIAPVQKWWWLILAATMLAGISSFLVTRPLPPVYQSRVILTVGTTISESNPNAGDIGIQQQLTEQYTEILNTGLVEEATMEALGLEWLPDYSAVARTRSQLIEISVIDTNPIRAQRVADELAAQLIRMSPTGAEEADGGRQAFVEEQLQELQTDIEATRDEIARKQEELGQLFSASEIADLQAEITALDAKLTTLQTNFSNLLASTDRGASNSIRVIVPANEPVIPIGPNKPIIIVLAAVVGAGLAVAAAFLLEFLDDTIHTPEEVTRIAELPLLAGLPPFKPDASQNELVTFNQPRSHISEAFRVLRTGVQFASLDKTQVSILVTSGAPNEGKSLVSANLAVVLAQAGSKVLLVDADLRRPRQHKVFNLPNDRGLTSYLLEIKIDDSIDAIGTLLQAYIQKTDVPGLSVFTSGPLPPNPSELLGSTKMQMTFAALTAAYDYLVFDSTPVLAVTDALVMSTQIDNIILVTRSGQTRRGQLHQVKERLNKMKANVIGVVLNRWSTGASSDYYYYDYQTADDAPASANGKTRLSFPFPWKNRAREDKRSSPKQTPL